MTKPHPKPSDRGRNSPEPGPPPGARAEQRDTLEQLESERGRVTSPEGPTWERDEQQHLPPRGQGSQHEQGDEEARDTRAQGPQDDSPAVPASGLHTGGTRGPSNDNR